MIRLYVSFPLGSNQVVTLGKEQSHYVVNVMRRKLGQELQLFNGNDGEWKAEIITASKRQVELQLLEQTKVQYDEPNITLCFAPVKNAPQHFLVQKATELGVSALQPVITKRTVISRVNLDKLKANVIEAAEQSGRLSVPQVNEPLSFQVFLTQLSEDEMLIFCDETGGGDSALSVLSSLPNTSFPSILIGPEGGFSPEEIAQLREKKQAVAVGLGPRILRADTAALAALTIVQATLGDWQRAPAFKAESE